MAKSGGLSPLSSLSSTIVIGRAADPSTSSLSSDIGNGSLTLRVVAMRAKLVRLGAGQATVDDIVVTDEMEDALEERVASVIIDSGLDRADARLMTDGRREEQNLSTLGKGNSSLTHLPNP